MTAPNMKAIPIYRATDGTWLTRLTDRTEIRAFGGAEFVPLPLTADATFQDVSAFYAERGLRAVYFVDRRLDGTWEVES